MFDISWGELILIGMVALIVIGPKELPTVLRTMGQYMTKIRRMASEFQGQFNEAMREAEMSDLKAQVDGVKDAAKSFDPLQTIRNEFDNTFKDANVNVSDLTPSSSPAPSSSYAVPSETPINPTEFAPAEPALTPAADSAPAVPAAEPTPAPSEPAPAASEPHPERAALDGAPAAAPPKGGAA